MNQSLPPLSVIAKHYDRENGLGNAYKTWGDWPHVYEAFRKGWSQSYNHPAQLHYGLDFDGKHLSFAINKLTYTAFADLALPKPNNATILEPGCGIGGTSFTLAQKYPNLTVYGVSLSNDQIAVANARKKILPHNKLQYLNANYLSLPLRDATFDGILAIETFVYIQRKDKQKLLNQMYRVLKKGARLVVYDGFLSSDDPTKLKLKSIHKKIAAGWAIDEDIGTSEHFLECAKNAHFSILTDENITPRILASSKEARNRAYFFTPIVTMVQFLKKCGIPMPLMDNLGLTSPDIESFAYTGRMQYEVFKAGDIQYKRIVLKK